MHAPWYNSNTAHQVSLQQHLCCCQVLCAAMHLLQLKLAALVLRCFYLQLFTMLMLVQGEVDDMRESLEDLLFAFGVDIVFAGVCCVCCCCCRCWPC